MKHARQKIREYIATALAAISGAEVYRSRVYPLVTLPAISVYVEDENATSENETMPSPARYSRTLSLIIEIAVESTQNYDDLVDDYAAQVEVIMAADVELGGTATYSVLQRTVIDLGGDSDIPIAIARLNYFVWYRTTGSDPENAL